jgi:uncharacterized protein (DUF697 family)
MSDEYLDKVQDEIVAWEKEGPSWLANVGSFILTPAQKIAESFIPQAIQDAVARAIEAFLMGISSFSIKTVAFQKLKEAVNAKVEIIDGRGRDIQFLIAADDEARSCWNYHIGYAAVEGCGTGAAGLFGLAADVPALFTIVIRLIQEIGTCYGYDMTKPEEQEYVLHLLRAGSAGDIKAKVEALIALKQIEEILIKVTWKKMAQELAAKRLGQLSLLAALREFAKSLGINLTKRKALQMVPVIGAIVGASFNATYANDIGKAAFMSFRRRFIAEKFFPPPH